MVYKLEYFRNSKCSKTEWAVYDDFIYDWMLFDDDDDDDGIRWQKNWVVPCIREYGIRLHTNYTNDNAVSL